MKGSNFSEVKTGIDLIAEERRRQIEVEGFNAEHDKNHKDGELANAAVCYALDPMGGDASAMIRNLWPWESKWFKPTSQDGTIEGRIKELKKAGALIAAEIDLLIAKSGDEPMR